MKKIVVSTMAGAVLATGGAFALSSQADAAGKSSFSITSQCKGSIIDSGYLRGGRDGQVAGGQWQLWYSPNNGGTNCVVVYDKASGKHDMHARLEVKGQGGKTDSGTFNTFAGGVQGTNTNHRCILITGHVGLGNYSLGTMVNKKGNVVSGKWSHCG